jgi:hypothetical protein
MRMATSSYENGVLRDGARPLRHRVQPPLRPGGTKAEMEKQEPQLNWAIQNLEPK